MGSHEHRHDQGAASVQVVEERPRGGVPAHQDHEHRAGFQRLFHKSFRRVSGKRIPCGDRRQGGYNRENRGQGGQGGYGNRPAFQNGERRAPRTAAPAQEGGKD